MFGTTFQRYSIAVLGTLVVRSGVILLMPGGLDLDTDGYRQVAVCLRETGVYGVPNVPSVNDAGQPVRDPKATAYRPPLYPLLLAALMRNGAISATFIGVFHVILGSLTAAMVLWLGGQWKLQKGVWVALVLTAFDPIQLHQSTQIMTETLATFLATAALACLTMCKPLTGTASDPKLAYPVRDLPKVFSAGIVIGLACLCRPTFLPWACLLLLQLSLWRNNSRGHWRQSILLAGGILVVVLPWGLRNWNQFGHIKISTTHGGYTLLLGNNPNFYRYLREAPWGAVWDGASLDREWSAKRSHIDEFADDRLAYAWARESIRNEPRMFAYACLIRIARLWHVLPHGTATSNSGATNLARYAVAVWYSAMYALVAFAIVRSWRQIRKPPWLWGILLCVAFTAVHSLYWSDMRMRAPLLPFLALVAGLGADEIVKRGGTWARVRRRWRAGDVSPLNSRRTGPS